PGPRATGRATAGSPADARVRAGPRGDRPPACPRSAADADPGAHLQAREPGKPGLVLAGAPVVDRHQAGFDQIAPVEEPPDLLPCPGYQHTGGGLRRDLLERADLLLAELAGGEVADHDGASRDEAAPQRLDRPVDDVVRDEMQDGDEHQADGPAEVEVPGDLGVVQDALRFPEVALHRDRLPVVREQCPGVHEHDRVIVHVDDPRLGRGAQRDLVHVLLGGEARADVEELPDPVADQEPHRPADEPPVGQRLLPGVGRGPEQLLRRLPVYREVVLASQHVVVDAGHARNRGIDARWRLLHVTPLTIASAVHDRQSNPFQYRSVSRTAGANRPYRRYDLLSGEVAMTAPGVRGRAPAGDRMDAR